MKHRQLWLCPLFALLCFPVWAFGDEKFEFKDGDRVVLIGNTLIEREQRYGYWETAITARYPDRNITFRNLGWSGDTVFGDAQAGFGMAEDGFKRGTASDGFKHLKEHVFALKPTVIIAGYGGVEAFKGEKGLAEFVDQFNTLLDALAPTKARMVLVSPTPMERLAPPLPDPTVQNKNLRLYAEAIGKVAEKRQCFFVDFYSSLRMYLKEKPYLQEKTPPALTDEGLHLTGYGYWVSTVYLEDSVNQSYYRKIELDMDGKVQESRGVKLEQIKTSPLRFRALDTQLPRCPFPTDSPKGSSAYLNERTVTVNNLGEGTYVLNVDGIQIAKAHCGSSLKWEVDLIRSPEFDQVEKLRQTIIEKNRLYFHRWRPQNDTYLFGFRKQEQGQNAREIPQFDPLIEEKEKEIAKLRVPVPHTYELVPSK